MFQKTYKKKYWNKFIIAGVCNKENENLGIYTSHVYRGINQLHWERLWMYLNHQFIAINAFSSFMKKSAIISDYTCLDLTLKNIALRSFSCLNVDANDTGDLTNIPVYTDKPNFIVNFGMAFPKRFFGEAKILLTPTINFVNELNFKLYRGVYYNIPFANAEIFLIKQLATYYVMLLNKNNTISSSYTPALFEMPLHLNLRNYFAKVDFKTFLFTIGNENKILLRWKEKKWFKFVKRKNYSAISQFYWKFFRLRQYISFFQREKKIKKKQQQKYSRFYKQLKNYREKKKLIVYKHVRKNYYLIPFLSQKLYIYQFSIKAQRRFKLFELQQLSLFYNYNILNYCKKIFFYQNILTKKQLFYIYFNTNIY